MNIIQKVRFYFYQRALKKATKKSANIMREMVNINNAQHIGVLYNATNPKDIATIAQWVAQWQKEGKKVSTLGYINNKSKDGVADNFFDKNNINWYEVPFGEKIEKFQAQAFDILISTIKEESLPLEYLVASSKAKFRVGAFSQAKTNYYELMINVKQHNELPYLLKQIVHFLKVINKNDK